MTLFSESTFSIALIDILKDIHFELKRSNDLHEQSNIIAKEGNESFYKEQQINREVEEEALEQTRNINHNFNAVNRKLDSREESNE